MWNVCVCGLLAWRFSRSLVPPAGQQSGDNSGSSGLQPAKTSSQAVGSVQASQGHGSFHREMRVLPSVASARAFVSLEFLHFGCSLSIPNCPVLSSESTEPALPGRASPVPAAFAGGGRQSTPSSRLRPEAQQAAVKRAAGLELKPGSFTCEHVTSGRLHKPSEPGFSPIKWGFWQSASKYFAPKKLWTGVCVLKIQGRG